ncbi:MAG: TVP38/TMEM64 family protein [Pseudomonadota bacterium]
MNPPSPQEATLSSGADLDVTQNTSVQSSSNAKPKSSMLKRFLPLIVIVGAMGAAFAFGLNDYLSLSALIRQREVLAGFITENYLVSVLGFGVLYAMAVALSFPAASLLTIAAGFLFGWMVGGAAVLFAASIGATALFLAARTAFGQAIAEKAGPTLKKLLDGFKDDAFNYLLFLRLTPVFPFTLVNIAPALVNMPLRGYFIATFMGIAPGTFAYAFVGSGLDSVIAAQELANPGCSAAGTCSIDLASLVTKEIIFAFAALGSVALIPPVMKKLRARKKAQAETAAAE